MDEATRIQHLVEENEELRAQITYLLETGEHRMVQAGARSFSQPACRCEAPRPDMCICDPVRGGGD